MDSGYFDKQNSGMTGAKKGRKTHGNTSRTGRTKRSKV